MAQIFHFRSQLFQDLIKLEPFFIVPFDGVFTMFSALVALFVYSGLAAPIPAAAHTTSGIGMTKASLPARYLQRYASFSNYSPIPDDSQKRKPVETLPVPL